MDFQNDGRTGGETSGDAIATDPGATEILQPDSLNRIAIPDGLTIDEVESSGRDLVLILSDGSRVIVPNGAVFVPEISVDGVVIPSDNLAALLTGNEPEPAAGNPRSSGGNFAVDPGDIQAAFDIGDLLPFSTFDRGAEVEEEIIPQPIDREPDVVVISEDNPAGAADATASVSEAGLSARGDEPAGTAESSDSETTTGTIVVTALDGVGSISINGVAIAAVGQQIQGDFGILTITSIAPGAIGYSYTLSDNTLGDGSTDSFDVIVTDVDGDEAEGSLDVAIVDDAPEAFDDSNEISAGRYGPVEGNVLANDVQGADGAVVTSVSGAGGSGGAGVAVQGLYGVLTIEADGTYSYVRDAGTPGGVSDVFDYVIADGDGDTAGAQVIIAIADGGVALDLPVAGEAGTQVLEEGLDDGGSAAGTDGEVTNGTFTFGAEDGPALVTIDGVAVTSVGQVFEGDYGRLTITSIADGAIGYRYELTVRTDGDDTFDSFVVRVADADDESLTGELRIDIVDDVPTARPDTDMVQEDAMLEASGNVLTDAEGNDPAADAGADTPGADGVTVTGIAFEGAGGTVAGTVGTGLAGAYGTLTIDANGEYTYVLDNANAAVQGLDGDDTLSEVFTYTIEDGDGDVRTTTLTITVKGNDDPVVLGGLDGNGAEIVVDEDDLPARDGDRPGEPAGSSPDPAGLVKTGTFTITAQDGLATIEVGGVTIWTGGSFVAGQSIATAYGVLEFTGVSEDTVDANGDVTAATVSFRYTLFDNTLEHTGLDDAALTESYTVRVTDTDDSVATGSLDITVIDDVADAADDMNSIDAGEYGPVEGNVLANDVQGADGAVVTSVSGAGGSGGAGVAVQGLYGVLTIEADGTYSYVRDAGTPGGVSDVFDYVIADGDGDTAGAQVIIAIADGGVALDLPVAGEAGTQVLEEGLDDGGSAAGTDGEVTNGTFTFGAEDGPALVTIDGVAVTSVGQVFEGDYGRLTITSIADGAIGYRYELTVRTDGDDTFDSFVVRVADADDESLTGELRIDIVDDVPTARPDTDMVQEDAMLEASGNVLTDAEGNDPAADAGADTPGADGVTVTGIAFEGAGGTVAGTVGTGLAGAYGTLTIDANGEYTYVLDNANAAVQGLDGDDTLSEVFTYTIEDGDGDVRTTTLTITVKGNDDPVVLGGLDGNGAEIVVDEDDLPARDGDRPGEPAGSSPDPAGLVKTGTFTITAQDGLATIEVGGVTIWTGGSFVAGQSIATAYGVLEFTGVSEDTVDANGDVTAATVSFRYTLFDNTLEHTGLDDAALTESYTVRVTDTDDSVATGSLDITVIDDVADAEDDFVEQAAEEDTLIIDALVNDTFGADDVDIADGTKVFVSQQATQGTVVYNTATGRFEYTPASGAGSDSLEDSFQYTIVDGDGDVSVATVYVTLKPDSVPAVVSVRASVDDDALAGGNAASDINDIDANLGEDPVTASEAIFNGKIDVAFGADGGTVTFANLHDTTAQVGTETVALTWDEGTRTLTATGPRGVLFDVVLAEDGTYTVTLRDNVLHEAGDEELSAADVVLNYRAVDGDTDPDIDETGTLTIEFNDDAPTAYDNAARLDEGTSITGNVLTDGTADAFGADGSAGVVSYTIDGTTEAAGSMLVTDDYEILINADGSYRFTALSNTVDASITLVITYTIMDGDGDTASAQLTFTIDPVQGNVTDTNVLVNEAGLDATGSLGTASDSEFDLDGAITATGGTPPYTYTLTSTPGSPLGILTLNTNGTYTYELTSNFDGPTLDNGTVTHQAVEQYGYTVTDANGNTIGSGFIVIDVIDDVPTARDEPDVTIAEDATTPADGNVFVNDTEGADGATVTHLIIDGIEYEVDPTSGVSVTTAKGTYTLDTNGAWTFDPAANLSQVIDVPVEAGFDYRITDGDGDTDIANQRILVTDGADPAAGNDIVLALHDETLADGTNPSATQLPSTSGSTTFTPGSDAIVSIAFGATTGLAANFTWTTVNANTVQGYDNGNLVVTLTLTTSGNTATVTAVLEDNYLHLAGDDNPTLGSIAIVATDTDGDTATANVSVTVSDDAPDVGVNETVRIDDDVLGGNDGGTGDDPDGEFTTGTLAHEFGADGGSMQFLLTGAPAGFRYVDTATGIAIEQEQEPGVWVRVVEVDLNASTGAYEVRQVANILHPDGDDENNVDFTLTYRVTDGDNDTIDGTLTIDVDDDTPIVDPNAPPTSEGAVDEEGLDDGIPGGTDDLPGEALTASGSVASFFLAGADVPLAYSLAQDDSTLPTGLTSGGVTVTYSIAGNTVTGLAGTKEVFTFTLDSVTGGWLFTLKAPLDHADDDGENDPDIVIDFGGLIQATDEDGDLVTTDGQVLVAIDDDSPVAVDDAATLTEDMANATGNVLTDGTADGFGADGAAAIAITAVTGTNSGGVGDTIQGNFGTLVIDANGGYIYALDQSLVQGLDTGESATDTFTYTIEDGDGDNDTAQLVVTITGANDAPVAADDTNYVIDVDVGPDPTTSGNVLLDIAHPGAPSGSFADVADTDVDGDTLTIVSVDGVLAGGTVTGLYGSLVVAANGAYTYTLDADDPAVDALPLNGTLTESFTYTVTDGDATTTAVLEITIFGTNAAPEVIGAAVAVSEEGIAAIGNPDDDPTTPADADTTDSATASGSITITDIDAGASFDVTLGLPTDTLTASNGIPITWDYGTDAQTVIGYSTDPLNPEITFTIDDTGAFTVTLAAGIRHDDPLIEDLESFVVPVLVSDGIAPAVSTSVEVTIEDDSPVIGAMNPASQTIGNFAGATATGLFPFSPGGDDHGAFDIAYVGPAIDGVTYDLQQVDSDMDGINDSAVLTASAGTDTLYTLTVDTDGTYAFTLVTPDAGTTEDISLLNLSAGGPDFRELEDDPTTPNVNEAGSIEFSSNGNNGVNASNQGFGVDDQWTDEGEFFTLEFHNPGNFGTDDDPEDDADILSGITLNVQQVRGGPVDIEWTATRYNDDGTVAETQSGTLTVNAAGQLVIPTTINFSELKIENIDSSKQAALRFKAEITVEREVLPRDQDFDFEISATDRDGDPTATVPLTIFVDADQTAPAFHVAAPADVGGIEWLGGMDISRPFKSYEESHMRSANRQLDPVAAGAMAAVMGLQQPAAAFAATAEANGLEQVQGALSLDGQPAGDLAPVAASTPVFQWMGMSEMPDSDPAGSTPHQSSTQDVPLAGIEGPDAGEGEATTGPMMVEEQVEAAPAAMAISGDTGGEALIAALLAPVPPTAPTAAEDAKSALVEMAAEMEMDSLVDAFAEGGVVAEARAGTTDIAALLNASLTGSPTFVAGTPDAETADALEAAALTHIA